MSKLNQPKLTGVFVELEARAKLRQEWAAREAQKQFDRERATLVRLQEEVIAAQQEA